MDRKEEAKTAMEKAFSLDTGDSRVFFELDQLYKKFCIPVQKRLEQYENYRKMSLKRDDACIEYVTLLNLSGRYEEALHILTTRKFHP